MRVTSGESCVRCHPPNTVRAPVAYPLFVPGAECRGGCGAGRRTVTVAGTQWIARVAPRDHR